MAASHLETAVARLLGAEGDPFAVSRLFYWLSESRWMHQSIVSRILRGIIEDTFPHLTGRMQTWYNLTNLFISHCLLLLYAQSLRGAIGQVPQVQH